MSLLIHGTKLPRSNTMTNAVIRVRQDGTAEIIIHYEHKSESFKLTEVPTPHGRLIDADELFCKIDGIKGWDYGDESDMAISAAEALSAINDSPTVIEAEVSE